MKEFVLHLLVLSHVYMVPHLKRECEQKLELGLLTMDNLLDFYMQIHPFIANRQTLRNFNW